MAIIIEFQDDKPLRYDRMPNVDGKPALAVDRDALYASIWALELYEALDAAIADEQDWQLRAADIIDNIEQRRLPERYRERNRQQPATGRRPTAA